MDKRLLIEYLPNILKEVREYRALMIAEQPEIDALWTRLENTLNDLCVSTATEYGIIRWERILKITPKATFTLDERRFAILTRFMEQLPYTMRKLENMLTELCGANGYKIDLDHANYTLDVKVALTAKNNFDDVGTMLKRIVPANLIILLMIEFNQWFKLQPYTWDYFSSWTWNELMNEVI